MKKTPHCIRLPEGRWDQVKRYALDTKQNASEVVDRALLALLPVYPAAPKKKARAK